MKKTIALLLSALLLLGALAGCGTQTEKTSAQAPATEAPAPTAVPTPATPAPTPEPTEAPTVGDAPVTGTPEGSVLFDKDGLKVTTAGLDVDPTAYDDEPIIWVDIENSGDTDAYLGVTDGAVNGFMTDVYLVSFYEEDEETFGSDYSFDQTIPAGETVRYALGYNAGGAPGIDLTTLGELTFYFTLAEDEYSWPDYTSAPITVQTGEDVPDVDIAALGTVVIDNDKLLLVFGEQDYDGFFGPTVDVFLENKTDGFIGLTADTAEADGVFCDYIYGSTYAAPHLRSAGSMCFDGEVGEMKGFENLSVVYSFYEGETYDRLNSAAGTELDPVSVTYPPQIWGAYENDGFTMEITPKYNSLVTVETPENDEFGVLFDVYETASRQAGDHDGAGWLFSIGKVDTDLMHEILCYDMSGAEVFAKDGEGNYYLYYHPTDVRFERATVEEMQRDAWQWSMLNEWAGGMKDRFLETNGLEYASFGNSEVDMYVARGAWDKDATAYLATTEFMDVDSTLVDGTPWAEFVLQCWFCEADEPEDEMLLSGEHLVLGFLPDENVLLHFYPAGGYVRVENGDSSQLYQAMWYDDNVSCYEAMLGWYYACAEKAGKKNAADSRSLFCGVWAEEIAGRAMVTIEKSLAPGKVNISVRWPESASVCHFWTLTARSEENALFYENGEWEVLEFDADGDSWTNDSGWDETGSFERVGGKLVWHDDTRPENGEVIFIRAD